MQLSRLLRPDTVAVIGGTPAERVAEQCDRMGFKGSIWPVHPTRKTVADRDVYRSIDELPGAPDAAFVGVNRHATVEAVGQLAARGAGGAICYASGFLEAEDGGNLQRELVDAAAGMPIVGPNCYGLINYLDGVPLWPDQHGGRRRGSERGVAIVTQSSNLAISITMQRRGLPIAYVVTVGNQAQLGVPELAAALLEDERVSAVGLHVEGFDSATGYEALANRARQRRVPVVVMKVGRSTRGRQAVLSHTASIAGSESGAEAFVRRLGFARAGDIPELLETLKLLHVHGPLDGSRLGAMCCSGGEASLLADAAEAAGATLPALSPDQVERVSTTVHPLVNVTNPLDYHTFSWGDEPALVEIFTAFDRGAFDATLLMLDFPRADRCDDADWQTTLRAFGEAMRTTGGKGIVAATLAENLSETHADGMMAGGLAPLAGVREAFAAIDGAAVIGAAWSQDPPPPILSVASGNGDLETLDEAAAKTLLAEQGVPVPPGDVARDEAAAVAIANALGGSVAVKALGVAHKTERHAVRLDLREPDAVRAATRDLLGIADSVLVEQFVPDTVVELIVGIVRDPQLGLLLAVGTGGVLVELFGDSVTLLLPVAEAEVRETLGRLRCAPLLHGHRGQGAADVDAAVSAILGITRFAARHHDRLEELDVNPLAVAPEGRGARALDVLIRTRSIEK